MSGCKIPEGKNEENCYRIWITGECDFLIVSPDMIAVLIAKMRRSDTREMTVPSEEVLPPEYAEYLTRVMEANEDGKNIYDMAVEQFRYLEVEQSSCFEKVNVTGEKKTQFDLEAGEKFYMLVRNTESRFRYVFCDEDGAEVSVLLEYIK